MPLSCDNAPSGLASVLARPSFMTEQMHADRSIKGRLAAYADTFLIPEWRANPESARRGRLATRFGFVGCLFGIIFTAFYFLIGHYWGAGITLACSVSFAITPFVMRATRALDFGGHQLTSIMATGFIALCCVEGGMRGHALAWLAGVPLCALLLVGKRPARVWVWICLAAASAVITVDLIGHPLPITYDPAWHPLVNAAGYLGLILFMFILGMVFEHGREHAFNKMQDALSRLEATNEKLIHLNNEKNEFLGIAAHDLKNPLAAIVGYAELIARQPTTGAIMAGKISGAAGRMEHLIKNLLDANAIEEGRFTSHVEACDLGALVMQSVEHNQMSATRKEIVLKVATPAGLVARADRNATIQILDNLVSNAVKYSPPKTTVQIETAVEDGWAIVSVKDQGPGLSAEDQKKLFRKFTRLTARPTGGESSNGLGLSIVKRLAEAMNGTVECRSVLGDGAAFVIKLPVWEK